MTPPCPPYRTILIAFAAFAAIIAGVSLPSEREKIALYERDGETSAALSQIDQHLSAGKRDPIILDAALRLHLRAGDVESALAVAQLIATSRPDSLAAQITVMNMLRDRGQYDRHAALAEQIYYRWKDPQTLKDVLRINRLRQNTEAEKRLLELATATGAASAAEIERLGMLKAAQGDHVAAINLLRYADGTREGIQRNARITLFELLIDQNRAEEAVRRATRWQATRPDHAAAAVFCAYLAIAGHIRLVRSIADAPGANNEEVYVACAERVSNLGEEKVVAQILAERISSNRAVERESAGRFIRLALGAGRPELAITLWSSLKSYALPPEICRGLALGAASLAMQGGINHLSPRAQYFLARHVGQLEAELLHDGIRPQPAGATNHGEKVHTAELEALGRFRTTLNGSIIAEHDGLELSEQSHASYCEGESDER